MGQIKFNQWGYKVSKNKSKPGKSIKKTPTIKFKSIKPAITTPTIKDLRVAMETLNYVGITFSKVDLDKVIYGAA